MKIERNWNGKERDEGAERDLKNFSCSRVEKVGETRDGEGHRGGTEGREGELKGRARSRSRVWTRVQDAT